MRKAAFVTLAIGGMLSFGRLASAHGGENHGEKPVAAGGPAAARASASSEQFEAVAVVPPAGSPIRLYIASSPNNQPVADATVKLTVGDSAFEAKAISPGVYEVVLPDPPHDAEGATVSIDTKDDSDLLAIESLPFQSHTEKHSAISLPMKAFIGGGLLAVAALLSFLAFRGRKRAVPTLILLLAIPAAARAHGGEDHGKKPTAKGGASSTNEDTSGGVRVLKEAQFLLGIKTVPAAKSKVVSRLRTLGRVVPRPRARAEVEAQQAGRLLSPTDDGRLPALGAFVNKGEVLGYIQVVDRLPIRAPISGIVTAVGHGAGESVEAGEKLITVTDLSVVWVEAWVYEEDVGEVEIANDAEVTAGAYAGKIFAAKRIGLSTEVEAESRAVIARLEVKNPDGKLRSGMLVDVNFLLPREQNVIVVPTSAIVERAGRPLVYVHRSPEVFEPRGIKVGTHEGESASILEGLEEGDRVVIDGAYDILAAQNAAGG